MAKKEQAKKSKSSKSTPVSSFWRKRGAAALDAIIGAQKSGILPSSTKRLDRISGRDR